MKDEAIQKAAFVANSLSEGASPERVIEIFETILKSDHKLRRVVYRAKLSAERGIVSLDDLRIRTEHQNKGYGSRVLAMLIDLCDKNGLTIKVVPAPPESDAHCAVSVTRSDLIRWYEDACFRRSTRYIWIRKPRTVPTGRP
jgi:GNAT superfamily N-acetyltransferase